MFNLVKDVPDPGLCAELKKSGYLQSREGWYWYRYHYDKDFYIGLRNEIAWEENPEYYYAPTVGELLGFLLHEVEMHNSGVDYGAFGLHIRKCEHMYVVRYSGHYTDWSCNESLANALAKLLIKSIEKGELI